MIPIDCKITNFCYTCLYTSGNNYNIGELISATSKERMTTLFSRVLHTLINGKFICQWASYLCMLTLLHSVIEGEEHEKSLLASIWKHRRFMHDSACPYDEPQWKGGF